MNIIVIIHLTCRLINITFNRSFTSIILINIFYIELKIFLGSFECECLYAGVWEQSIVVLTNSGRLQVVTLQGTVKQNIETDGQPITLSLTRYFMTISTITGLLQLWDLSRRYTVTIE